MPIFVTPEDPNKVTDYHRKAFKEIGFRWCKKDKRFESKKVNDPSDPNRLLVQIIDVVNRLQALPRVSVLSFKEEKKNAT